MASQLRPTLRLGRAGGNRGAFIAIAASVFFAQLGFYLTVSALPLYLHHVGVPRPRIGLDVGAGSFAVLLVALFAGPLLDRKGTRFFLAWGSICYVLAGLVMLAIASEPSIVAGRILQGVGSAMVVPSASAAVPLLTSRRVGSAVGIMSTVGSVPLAIGPAVGLALYTRGGSTLLLLPAIVVGLAGLALSIAVSMPARVPDNTGLPWDREDNSHKTTCDPSQGEPGGVVAGSASVRSRVESETAAEARAVTDQGSNIPGRVSLGLSAIRYDRRWTSTLSANLLNGVYFGGILAYLPLALARMHGPNAGIFFTADAIGVVVLRLPSGMLADRTRPAVPMVLGLLITVVGLAAFFPPTTAIWLILAGAGTGIGAGLFANGMLTELLAFSSSRNRGTAMSLAIAGASLGVFAGGAASGLLIGPTGFHGVIIFGAACELLAVPLLLAWQPRSSAKP